MKKTLIILVSFSLTFILLDNFHLIDFLKKPVDKQIIFLKERAYDSTLFLRVLPQTVLNYRSILEKEKKMATLEDQLLNLKIRNQSLKEENEDLRRQIQAPLSLSFKIIPAKVISLSRFLEIAVDGGLVRQGMPVVYGDILLGIVHKVDDQRSLVMLTTDQDLEIPAKSEKGAKGIVLGQFSNSLLFDKVLQKDTLFLNDLVLTSGEGGYPADLIIGKVTHIISDDVAVYKQAKLETVTDIDSKKNVFVIL